MQRRKLNKSKLITMDWSLAARVLENSIVIGVSRETDPKEIDR